MDSKPSFTDPEGRKITIAPSNLMDKFLETDVYRILCWEVLEYDPDEILVTDESCLTDFPEDRDHYIQKVKKVFNIDISDMKHLYLPQVLQRIVDSRRAKY